MPNGRINAFFFNDKHLYVIGGCGDDSQENDLNSMKRLNIFYIPKWTSINVLYPFSPRYLIEGIPISAEYNIYGGNDGYTCRECYVLDMGSVIVCRELCSLSFDGSYVYDVDRERNIHMFSLEERVWTI